MNLGKARIAYPFIKYSVSVTHHTERKSTAMEWILLEIAKKIESNPDYANIPLENILTSIFFVTDGETLLRQVLIDLVDVAALEQIPNLNDNSDWNLLRCGDLRLTNDGRRLQREGKLPANSQKNKLTVVYDVVNNRLVDNIKALSDDTTNPKAKDVDDNNFPAFPGSLIRQQIEERQANGKISWLQENSSIVSIEPEDNIKVKWRNAVIDITLDDEGNLGLSNEPDVEVVESVLKETDLGTMPDYELPKLSVSSLKNKKKFYSYDKLASNIESFASKENIFVVAPQFSSVIEGKSKKFCLLLGQPTFNFDDTGKNSVISIPDNIGEGFCYQDNSCSVYAAFVEGHIGNISRLIPFIYEEASDFSDFILELVKKYYKSDRRMMKLLDFVDNVNYQEFYTSDDIKELLNSAEIQCFTPIDKIIDRLFKIDDKIKKVLVDVPSPATSEKIRLALLNQNVEIIGDVHEWAIQWKESLESLKIKTAADVNSIDWQNTPFGLSLERMEQAAEAVSVFYDDVADRYNKVYVFDTSALMHYPDVLDDFQNNQSMAIIPKQVLIELESLKNSTDIKEQFKARQTLNKISEYGNNAWLNLNEDNYDELLSESYRETGIKDFFILSVALKYRVKNPVMVTDDTDFQDFAKSEKVETVTAHNLHEKFVGTLSKSKVKNKNKKKKK